MIQDQQSIRWSPGRNKNRSGDSLLGHWGRLCPHADRVRTGSQEWAGCRNRTEDRIKEGKPQLAGTGQPGKGCSRQKGRSGQRFRVDSRFQRGAPCQPPSKALPTEPTQLCSGWQYSVMEQPKGTVSPRWQCACQLERHSWGPGQSSCTYWSQRHHELRFVPLCLGIRYRVDLLLR